MNLKKKFISIFGLAVLLLLTACQSEMSDPDRMVTDSTPEGRAADVPPSAEAMQIVNMDEGAIGNVYDHILTGVYVPISENAAKESGLFDVRGDVELAMMNCGIENGRMIYEDDMDFLDAVTKFNEAGCHLIIAGEGVTLTEGEAAALKSPGTQFVIYSDTPSKLQNVCTYRIDYAKIYEFIKRIIQLFEQEGMDGYEEMLTYEVTCQLIFEEILSIYSEMASVYQMHYDWGIDERCVLFPKLNHENLTDDLFNACEAIRKDLEGEGSDVNIYAIEET